MPYSATVSSKGQIVIPVHVRRTGRLRPGERLAVRWEKGRIVLERAGNAHDLEALAREVRVRYRTRDLERELRRERNRDHRREKQDRP